jgi:hypothetical protein
MQNQTKAVEAAGTLGREGSRMGATSTVVSTEVGKLYTFGANEQT